MNLDDILSAEAEQAEYARVVSKRIGELVAEKINVEGFVAASDEDLRNLVMTILLLVMNELGEEALDSASTMSEALGFGTPSQEVLDAARKSALEATANRLYAALEEARANAQRDAEANGGLISESLGLGIVAALSLIFAESAQGLATDLPVAVNRAMGSAVDGTLTWITRHDKSVCQEEGPSVKTMSGLLMPPGAGTSCEPRHNITLPASDWVGEGFPRDSRLLCSRYKRPRCRCLVSVRSDIPIVPVDIGPDVERGRERGEEEPLDVSDGYLNAISVQATGQKIDKDVWELRIRVRKRVPVGVTP